MEQYKDFAFVYDELMNEVDYNGWVKYIEDIIKNENAQVQNILELACGTGNLTIPLTKKNYDIAGIDISEEMLSVAREKAEKEGVELVLLQQDIAELDFDVPNLDCILCACDGFNYLTYDDELESVFEKSYELLKDDGVFIFDISSYYKLSTILGNNMYGENREDVAYMWQNYFDSEENVVEMELAFFIKEEDGRFTRFEEVHQQRAYTEKEVLKMLKKAGFTNVKTYGDFTFEDPKEEARRLHETSKVATAALGRTLTATSMMGLMMKNKGDKLSVIIKGGGPIGTILTTSDVNGIVKGYVSNPKVEVPDYENGKLNVAAAVGTNGVVKVIKDLGLREPYNGAYPLVSGEIAEDFTHYFAVSEQTPSVVALGVLTTETHVECAGGLIVQLMPDATEETISQLEKNIQNLKSITTMLSEGKTPEDMLDIVLEGLQPRILDKIDVKFECECCKDKVQEALVAIGKTALSQIIEEDKQAEVGCQFCNSKYMYNEEELLNILKDM